MTAPRYLVRVEGIGIFEKATLAEACECSAELGGRIYEPLAMSASEKMDQEDEEPTNADVRRLIWMPGLLRKPTNA